MRLLVAIPHYWEPGGLADGRPHASTAADPAPRAAALSRCIAALHTHWGPRQGTLRIKDRAVGPANDRAPRQVEILVLTDGRHHVLDRLAVDPTWYRHRPTPVPPTALGFACWDALRGNVGGFDMYAYMEDDLILGDPMFFEKVDWFRRQVGPGSLLLPNRYETSTIGPIQKLYIDGEIHDSATADLQDRSRSPTLRGEVMGLPLEFERPSNPHAGCFFLDDFQLQHWIARPDFHERDPLFIGPLESAASLGVMRAFNVYKPAQKNASFLEIEHAGTGFISLLKSK